MYRQINTNSQTCFEQVITWNTKAAIPIPAQLTVFGVHGAPGILALLPAEVVPKRGGGQKPRLLSMEALTVWEITWNPKAAIAIIAQLTVFGVHGVHGEVAL